MTEPEFSSLAEQRLRKLQELQELRRQRDAVVAHDPGGARRALVEEHPTPLDFAERFDMRTKRTPALELISRKMRETVDTRDGRLVVSMPPQEGKTTTLRWLIVWLLCDNPDRRIVSISFAQSLARQTGREVRNHLRSHPELCLPLDRSHQDATDWGIEGRAGGLYSVGIGGALTGRPADVLIVDDPLKGREQADSDTVRDAMHDWWSSVARTRPAPGSPMIITQTRWHEDDLAGRMVESGWPYVNIPALADGQTEDALERPPGEWLISARGRSRADWEMVRADVGERDFAALYQGRPAPLEGGIFQHAWFDAHRISEDHRPGFVLSVVGVDPADTGRGDAAGILVAGLTRDGKIVFTDDLSAQLTQAQWARKACLAWIRHGATRIVQEHNLGMRTSIPDAWALLFRQAKALADVDESTLLNGDDGRPPLAFDELTARGDSQAADLPGLRNILSVFRQIVDAGEGGPRVVSITPKQSKRVRAESVAGAFETGRACMLGRLPKLEFEACFPAGTPVLTARGQVSIEQVTTNDRVQTRNGWRSVRWSGQTGVQSLLELRTADGHVLRATPNHRVWVEGQGWTRLEFVTSGCRMRACPGLAPVSTSPSRAGTTRYATTVTGRRTDGQAPGTSSDSSTVMSGLQLTGPSQRGGTSTISTTTSPTTTWGTFAPCPQGIMRGNILDVAGPAGMPVLVQHVGGRTGPSVKQLPASASTAEASSSQPVSEPSTAMRTAVRSTTASGDETRSELATTPPFDVRSTTVLSVEPVSGPPVPVYDLTVAGDHEFFAGGMLVHNCTWQEGQRSPNRIDVLAMLTTHLEAARGHARVSKVSDVGGAVIPINTAKSRSSVAGRPGVTPMEMRRAMRHNAQSPHEKDA